MSVDVNAVELSFDYLIRAGSTFRTLSAELKQLERLSDRLNRDAAADRVSSALNRRSSATVRLGVGLDKRIVKAVSEPADGSD